jgi:hypothetical protein
MSKRAGSMRIVLRKLPANDAWAFLLGKTVLDAQIVSIGGKRFFDTKEEAIAMAKRHGWGVDRAGFVFPEGPKPIMKHDPRHLNCGPGMARRGGGRHRNMDRPGRYQLYVGASPETAKIFSVHDTLEDAMEWAEKALRQRYIEVYDKANDHILWSSDQVK